MGKEESLASKKTTTELRLCQRGLTLRVVPSQEAAKGMPRHFIKEMSALMRLGRGLQSSSNSQKYSRQEEVQLLLLTVEVMTMPRVVVGYARGDAKACSRH